MMCTVYTSCTVVREGWSITFWDCLVIKIMGCLTSLRGNIDSHEEIKIIIIIAELADHSPITIQNGSSNPSSRKNLDLRPYDRPYKVLLLTCVVNCTAGTPTPRLCPVVQWSVHWAPSRTTRVLILAGARHCALETCRKKKMQAPFLGLAKSIYYTELKFKIRAVLMVTFSWLAS